jgi:SAM-dependent methyltransferase
MMSEKLGTAVLQTRKTRFVWIFSVAALCAGLLVRALLVDYSDPRHFNSDPLPRKGLNAPFIKTVDPVVNKMIELGSITDEDLVYDLGCGDGKILIGAAVQRGCHGVGFDIDPQRVTEAIENAKLNGVENLVTFKEQDVFKVDLRDANVIVMYLLPWMIRDLVPQFDQCPPGTRIVSHDWKIEGVKEQIKVKVPVEEQTDHLVYLYVTPLEKLPPAKPRKRVIN